MKKQDLGLKTLQVLVAHNYVNRQQLQEAIDVAGTSVEVNDFVCESVNAMLEAKLNEEDAEDIDDAEDDIDVLSRPAVKTRAVSPRKASASEALNIGYAEEICGFVGRMHRTPVETNEDERLLYNRLSKHRSRYTLSNESAQPLSAAIVEIYESRGLVGILQHPRIRDAYEGTAHCAKWRGDNT